MTVRRLRADEAKLFKDLRLRALADAPSAFAHAHDEISAKPESYWDDFFALKGLEDAGRTTTMRADLAASIRRTIAEKKIDYIPGAAELGDFDPSAMAIAIPSGASCCAARRARLLKESLRKLPEMPRTFIE